MKLKKESPDAEIPASSMADIAFLLIVYFMVTTTFAATRGLDFALPKDDDTPPIIEKEDSVLVEIDSNGQLIVDQKPMELKEILGYLAPKLETNPKKPVIIRPESNAPYGKMVQVFDKLRQGKVIDSKEEEGVKKLVWLDEQVHPGVTKELLEEGKDINVTIPTQREIDAFWF